MVALTTIIAAPIDAKKFIMLFFEISFTFRTRLWVFFSGCPLIITFLIRTCLSVHIHHHNHIKIEVKETVDNLLIHKCNKLCYTTS